MSKKRSPKRNSRGLSERSVGTRDTIDRFLIVCEGERTEPNYFKNFRVPKTVEIYVYGTGYNTTALVEEAIRIKTSTKDEYDQIWCVFDRDAFPAKHFNEAINLAKANSIGVAYSNEAFELWYLLHFDYFDTAIERKDYFKLLSERLGHPYRKNSSEMYERLESLQATAIKNAKKLLSQYIPPKPDRDNPSTTVHLLVEEINRFKR